MEIFGNPVPPAAVRRAVRRRRAFARRFAFDPDAAPRLGSVPETTLADDLPLDRIVPADTPGASSPVAPSTPAVVVGTLRMGYGHYRIGLALASAARALGVRPLWFDLLDLPDTPGAAAIRHLEGLYNLGSRLSRRFPLFDRLYWEHLTARGFRSLSYHAGDREFCTLLAPAFRDLDPALPLAGTHSWVCQAALHAGPRRVVNAIPDNWPLALHLSEGAVHAVQSPSAWLGYRLLSGMGRPGEILRPMPAGDLILAGHYVAHDLAAHLESDAADRIARIDRRDPPRLLVSIGGAGTQADLAARVVLHLAPRIRDGAVALFVNCGEHLPALDFVQRAAAASGLEPVLHTVWEDTRDFAAAARSAAVRGLHLFRHDSVFPAVATTDRLLRATDLLLTKPSELAFAPVPRLFLPRVGGHEAWGAIRAAELEEGTAECPDAPRLLQTLDLLLHDPDPLRRFNEAILRHHRDGLYGGAYRVIELALERP
jgi:hypothetical protein